MEFTQRAGFTRSESAILESDLERVEYARDKIGAML